MLLVDPHHQRSQVASLPIRNRPIMKYGSKTRAPPFTMMERFDCMEKKMFRWLTANWISAELACSFWKMEKNEKKTAKMLRTDPNVTEDDCFRSCYQEIGCKYIQYENKNKTKFRLTSLPTSSELDRQTSSTDVTGVKLQATPAAEVDGWVYYKATNMCYKIFDDYSNFDEAEKNCNGYDGHLASIHSMEHNQFLLALDPNMDEDDADAWIGLKIEGQCELHWMDGSDLDFQNWVQRQPDCNKTSTLMMSSGQWYTENGHHGNPFVCETESTIYCPQHVT
ncbi:hypothetical protein RB195_008437 [Necator americanus]|uniref:C-type lectin domain-containing protein n=1 Tax=Necator americanus TaxID=51031 RepID=A0ABR1CNN2_NECAM